MDARGRLGSSIVPSAISTVVFLVGLRISIGTGLIPSAYLQLLGSLVMEGAPASVFAGVTIQALIGMAWGVVYVEIFETPTRLNAGIFSVWQTMLTIALMEIVLLPSVGSSLTSPTIFETVPLIGSLWILHLVYMMTFLSVRN